MPVFDMTEENFLEHPVWDVFTFGVPPVAIDIMISMEGFSFSDIYFRSVIFKDDGLEVRVIHKNDLIALKKKAGRSKDLDDLENLK
jgi:predicted nucleotidyltransferase